MTAFSTTENFIRKARAVHSNTYDYSKVKYRRAHAHVVIICKLHGLFKQAPTNHLMGRGCPGCKGQRISKTATRTRAEVLRLFQEVHGNRYDYHLVEYVSGTAPVKIICNIHGVFKQQPAVHLRGNGCQQCAYKLVGRKQTKTTKQFIAEAREVHGNKYTYARSVYTRGKDPVTITCRKHGDFTTSPLVHLRGGGGCHLCGKPLPQPQEFFLRRAEEVHGKKYNYTKTKYTGTKHHVTITCPKHGNFRQEAGAHLAGQGCRECSRENKPPRYTNEQFTCTAQKIHGAKYDYSEVKYTNSKTNVVVICPKHGQFKVNPSAHTGKHAKGCPKCAAEIAVCSVCGKKTHGEQHRLHTDGFVKRARKKHGNRYDYSEVRCYLAKTRVRIRCRKHGVFTQQAGDHLQGKGCPKCAQEKTGKSLRLSRQEFIPRARILFGDEYSYARCRYTDTMHDVYPVCREHGRFRVQARKHLEGIGCPWCAGSAGEVAVAAWLKQHKIQYRRQWTKHDCIVNSKPARFDFYLPRYKVLVEYDGEQHYKPVKHWIGAHGSPQKQFEAIQRTDRKKDAWARKRQYTLVRIPHHRSLRGELQKLERLIHDKEMDEFIALHEV